MLTTRARWQVGAKSSKDVEEALEFGLGGRESAGEMGKIVEGDGGTRTGNVVVGGCEDGGGLDEVDEDEGGAGTFIGRPEAARALTTASQPVSRVLILSFSSSFSLSLAFSLARCSSTLSSSARRRPMRPIPARSCLFSSSSSATRRSRYENWALRRSREFCAAIRLRWARASLRSSGVVSERDRLRGGPARSEEEGAGDWDDSAGDGG